MLTEGKIANWSVDFAPPGPAVEARMWLPKRLDFSKWCCGCDDEAKVTKLQAQNKVGKRQQKGGKEKNGDLLIYTTTYRDTRLQMHCQLLITIFEIENLKKMSHLNFVTNHNVSLEFDEIFAKKFQNSNSTKNLSNPKRRKNSSKFVYIIDKLCRSHFNLTNFLTKDFKILWSRGFTIFTNAIHPELVGTHCIKSSHNVTSILKIKFVRTSPWHSILMKLCMHIA